MAYLTREQILNTAGKLQREEVPVPEWGGSVLVRELTAEERDAYEASIFQAREVNNKIKVEWSRDNTKAKLACRCIISEAGESLFSQEDVDALGRLSATALNRVVDVIQRLSAMTSKDIEELEGN